MSHDLPRWAVLLINSGLVVAAILILHWIIFSLLVRLSRRTETRVDDILVVNLRRPSFWLLLVIALAAVNPGLPLSRDLHALWQRIAGLAGPAMLGWVVVALLRAVRDILIEDADVSVDDNLRARRRRTRIGILYRITIFLVLVITICLMLISIPSVRSIGVTLMASAGLAGLVLGAAAQPALKNLIAGVQMAFTEPIRLDDVVIIDDEWGRIEDIRLTYVVVKIWDERRLVVPVSKFLENSFQNWTREASQLLGTSFFYVDPAADVARLRAKLEDIVATNANWDRRVVGLQVTDLKPDNMELRALVSASNASKAFDLRCDIREAMMAFIATEMPEALPRYRRQVAITASQPGLGPDREALPSTPR